MSSKSLTSLSNHEQETIVGARGAADKGIIKNLYIFIVYIKYLLKKRIHKYFLLRLFTPDV